MNQMFLIKTDVKFYGRWTLVSRCEQKRFERRWINYTILSMYVIYMITFNFKSYRPFRFIVTPLTENMYCHITTKDKLF